MSKIYFFFAPPLICVAFFTLLERKILSIVGFRLGPNKVSFMGVLQPILDALKLANKSLNILSSFSFFFYYFSSFLMIMMSLSIFLCLGFVPSLVSFKFSVLFFFLILGCNSLNSMISGWSVYSKFSLIGSIRTVCQLISYEAVLFLCVFFFTLIYGTLNFSSFNYYIIFFPFLFIVSCFFIWMPTYLAELNRSPFDFSEGESELVSGFNTEFGSGSFTMIFLAEYANIVFFSLLGSFLFLESSFFFFFFFFTIWVRSVLPRSRFDKLMFLSWKFFIPLLTFIFVCFFLFFF